jgi:quercetin dioxygenase-like cupin family protein
MPVLKLSETQPQRVREGVTRRLVHGKNLMLVVIDFDNGPWAEPEPFHSHVHEQATYVAEGEFIFLCEGEPDQRLSAGDMFFVHSNKKHTIQLLSKTVRLIDSFNPVRKDFLETIK